MNMRPMSYALVLVMSVGVPLDLLAVQSMPVQCDADNAGLELPDGFCALTAADGVGRARHMAVSARGDVYVALMERDGGVLALRDTDGDGRFDRQEKFGSEPITAVAIHDGYIFFSTTSAIMRSPKPPESLLPDARVDTVVSGLPTGGHRTKNMTVAPDGSLFVTMGSRTNSCQTNDRQLESPGRDPCTELETRAGIWKFDAKKLHQTQADGVHYARGLRNPVAKDINPADGKLYAVVHGRDQLFQNWPKLYDARTGAENPGEEFVRIEEGDRFSWPYCYYDTALSRLVQSPEYGGDARRTGNCATRKDPLLAFPAHWAPLGLHFYRGGGDSFPAAYRRGAFVAFHGSWNRAPEPQGGYKVVFVPFDGADPVGGWTVFADGFAGEDRSPRGAKHRPVDIVEAPDGSLIVSDDRGGRIYRIIYAGK